jgi:hypothetical protein
MSAYLAIRQNAAGELVVLAAICSLDNCFEAVTFLSAGGCELLQCPPSKANIQAMTRSFTILPAPRSKTISNNACNTLLTTPSAVVLDRFNTLLNWKTPLLPPP